MLVKTVPVISLFRHCSSRFLKQSCLISYKSSFNGFQPFQSIKNQKYRYLSNDEKNDHQSTGKISSTESMRKVDGTVDEIISDKTNTKKVSKWQKIRKLGNVAVTIYAGGYLTTLAMVFCCLHWKLIDISTIANLLDFGLVNVDKIHKTLNSDSGELVAAWVITEITDVLRIPMVLFITPPIISILEKRKNKDHSNME